jgi:hypothetical protein
VRRLRESLLVVCAYTLLTILFTYPTALRLSTHLPGEGGDTYLFVWNLWWIKKALTELRTNPFWTDYLFHPEGVSLVFHTFVPLHGLLGIPLQAFVGLVAATNLINLLTFILSGYGAYLLCRHLVADRISAFIGGMIFAFCPYRFAHLLGHFHLTSTEWLPFFALALLKVADAAGRDRIRAPLSCAVLLLLIALCDYYYLFYALILMALFVIYRLREEGSRAFLERDAPPLATALGLFLVGFAPILAMAGLELLREGRETVHGWGGATTFQADLLAYVTPSPLHPLLGPLTRSISGRFAGNIAEATVFAGYLPLILGLAALVKLRQTHRWARFWSLGLVTFFVLSLGPFPRILGTAIRLIPLPYQLVMRTPVLNDLRVPSRFAIMVMLSLAVLAAFACRRVLDRTRSPLGRLLIAVALTLAISFEYLALPFPMFQPSVPEIYRQMGSEPELYTVLDLPLGWRTGLKMVGEFLPESLYYQTVHEKRLVGGYVSRVPDEKIRTLEARPALETLLELQHPGRPGQPHSERPVAALISDLAVSQVRYLVIHRPLEVSRVRAFIESRLPVEKIYEENGVLAFRVIPDHRR